MSDRRATLAVLAAAFAGLAVLMVVAPEYLVARGFPLDDSWIHAVYGRSFARSLSLAYNPGIPATGATSPLWAFVVALPHAVWSDVDAIVAGIKAIGFALHVLTAVVIVFAFARDSRVEPPAAFGAMLVAFHPDLVSAAVSGMEVPLSTVLAAGLLLAVSRGTVAWYVVVSAVAPLARPELGLLAFALPVAACARLGVRRAASLTIAALVGTGASFAALAMRNIAVSGLPLPATFYAKAGTGNLTIPTAELTGFSGLLAQFPIADSSILVAAAVIVAAFVVSRRGAESGDVLAGAALLGSIAFCAVSFVLVRPVDPAAFYHQRYVLPVLPLLLVSLPPLVDRGLRWSLSARVPLACARGAVVTACAAALLVDAPVRYARLDNDARNVDDVQVAIGRSLAAAPRDQVVWAVDAGAIRYFGSALVVDLLGLNNGDLLGAGAQGFLDARPPRFIDVVPTWSELDDGSGRRLRGHSFTPRTLYTVTSILPMQQHVLVRCDVAALRGAVRVRGRSFEFTCPA